MNPRQLRIEDGITAAAPRAARPPRRIRGGVRGPRKPLIGGLGDSPSEGPSVVTEMAAQRHHGDLERLGDSADFAGFLYDVLSLNGWTIDTVDGFAGDGVIVSASHPTLPGIRIERAAPNAAAAAVGIFGEAGKYRRIRAAT